MGRIKKLSSVDQAAPAGSPKPPGEAWARAVLLADGVAEVENVDQFFNEAYECFEHGIAPWVGMGAGFPPDCPPGFLGGLPLVPKLWANRLRVAGADFRLGGVTRYGCDPFFLSARGSFCRISLRIHHQVRSLPFVSATSFLCSPEDRPRRYGGITRFQRLAMRDMADGSDRA
ncbi:hypothetical protein D3C71_546990 [compost metagenome]